MTKLTTDEKIDRLELRINKNIDEKIEELGRMIASGFLEVRTEMNEMRKYIVRMDKRIIKAEKRSEHHEKGSEKEHVKFDKRINIIERLQNI